MTLSINRPGDSPHLRAKLIPISHAAWCERFSIA
jgi:hypothetical protein